MLLENANEIAKKLLKKGYVLEVESFISIEQSRRSLQNSLQKMQSERNRLAKRIGVIKGSGEDASKEIDESLKINKELESVEKQLNHVLEKRELIISEIPNVPDDSVPEGNNDSDNVEIRKWGEIHDPGFTQEDHVSIGASLKMIDFDTAARITGSRFVVLTDKIARLHRALIHFMIDLHTSEHGYTETYVPYMVNPKSLFGTGQLPKFAEDQFMISGDPSYYLIPTAEVPVTNLFSETIVDEDALPIKRVCHTPCFRREAGSYGKDTKGLIRQHQFEKVELVHVVKPDDSWRSLEELTSNAEEVLKRLKLPYRVVTLCGGDLGFSAAKTYDLEVWLPGQQKYREISSCSNFLDFQARRMRARWRNKSTGKPELVHTLNGSGLAVGRTLVAIIENYQEEDGSLVIPDALIKYMGGINKIT